MGLINRRNKINKRVLTFCIIIKTPASVCCRRRCRRRRLIRRRRRQPTLPPASRRRRTRSRRRKRDVGVTLLLQSAVDAEAALLSLHFGLLRQVLVRNHSSKIRSKFEIRHLEYFFEIENFVCERKSRQVSNRFISQKTVSRTFPVRKLRTECRCRTRDGAIYFFVFTMHDLTLPLSPSPLSLATYSAIKFSFSLSLSLPSNHILIP